MIKILILFFCAISTLNTAFAKKADKQFPISRKSSEFNENKFDSEFSFSKGLYSLGENLLQLPFELRDYVTSLTMTQKKAITFCLTTAVIAYDWWSHQARNRNRQIGAAPLNPVIPAAAPEVIDQTMQELNELLAALPSVPTHAVLDPSITCAHNFRPGAMPIQDLSLLQKWLREQATLRFGIDMNYVDFPELMEILGYIPALTLQQITNPSLQNRMRRTFE